MHDDTCTICGDSRYNKRLNTNELMLRLYRPQGVKKWHQHFVETGERPLETTIMAETMFICKSCARIIYNAYIDLFGDAPLYLYKESAVYTTIEAALHVIHDLPYENPLSTEDKLRAVEKILLGDRKRRE